MLYDIEPVEIPLYIPENIAGSFHLRSSKSLIKVFPIRQYHKVY